MQPCSVFLLAFLALLSVALGDHARHGAPTPAPKFKPFLKLARKRLAGLPGLKPTKEDDLKRMSPDAFDDSSDEDTSDPLLFLPFDFEYIKYLLKNPESDFDRATIKHWQDDAKNDRFCDFDDTW